MRPALLLNDEHDDALRAHVQPPDHVNPPPAERYDMVVIGGGTAGLVTAFGAAGVGATVALVERDLLGGDCLNTGCVPSKALIAAARAAHAANAGAEFGITPGGPPSIDGPAVFARMRRLRAGIAVHDSVDRLRKAGIDVFLGSARFTGPDGVAVDGASLRFKRACIATGARAALPPVPGLAEAGVLTNETLFALSDLPPRLAVVGAGPIGCEMAQAFVRLGVRVVLIEYAGRALGNDDPEAAALVQQALADDGVELHFDAKLERVVRDGATTTLHTDGAHGPAEYTADAVLVAAGRAPNVADLGLDAAGVAYDEKAGVTVDDRYRTTNKRIFAAGDVASAAKFTHTADAAARAVVRNAFFFGRRRRSRLVVPWCTYTTPEVAHVGAPVDTLTPDRVDTHRIDLDGVDRALLDGHTTGFLKIHVAKGTDRIVAATMAGGPAGDVIGFLSAMMARRIGLGALSDVVLPYPTIVEIVRKAADAHQRTRLTPRTAKLLRTIIRMRR